MGKSCAVFVTFLTYTACDLRNTDSTSRVSDAST